VGGGERPSEHREVLGKDKGQAAVDPAPAGDHAVPGNPIPGHAELGDAMLDEHVELLEGALVEQEVDALAGRELALGVLGGDALGASAHPRLFAALLEFFQDRLQIQARPSLSCRAWVVGATSRGKGVASGRI
jgi:hypothetical protein